VAEARPPSQMPIPGTVSVTKLSGAIVGVQRVDGRGRIDIPELSLVSLGLMSLVRGMGRSDFVVRNVVINFTIGDSGITFGPVRASTGTFDVCAGGAFGYPAESGGVVWLLARVPRRFAFLVPLSPDVVNLLSTTSDEVIFPFQSVGSDRIYLEPRVSAGAIEDAMRDLSGSWRDEMFFLGGFGRVGRLVSWSSTTRNGSIDNDRASPLER
jgi:hypothetical protein